MERLLVREGVHHVHAKAQRGRRFWIGEEVAEGGAAPTAQRFSSTDDNLWRPTRRAKGYYTKDKLSTRRGAVHSIGWLCNTPPACRTTTCVPETLAEREPAIGGAPARQPSDFGWRALAAIGKLGVAVGIQPKVRDGQRYQGDAEQQHRDPGRGEDEW